MKKNKNSYVTIKKTLSQTIRVQPPSLSLDLSHDAINNPFYAPLFVMPMDLETADLLFSPPSQKAQPRDNKRASRHHANSETRIYEKVDYSKYFKSEEISKKSIFCWDKGKHITFRHFIPESKEGFDLEGLYLRLSNRWGHFVESLSRINPCDPLCQVTYHRYLQNKYIEIHVPIKIVKNKDEVISLVAKVIECIGKIAYFKENKTATDYEQALQACCWPQGSLVGANLPFKDMTLQSTDQTLLVVSDGVPQDSLMPRARP